MSPSRAAFLQEFDRLLSSPVLNEWFQSARRQHATVSEFADPAALRQFLHSREKDPRKYEIWRDLVIGLQANWIQEAVTYVLGLLDPGLGGLTDRFANRDVDEDDLWQEAISHALEALANPKAPTRNAVFSGLLLDTFSQVRWWLGEELSRGKNEVPLDDLDDLSPRQDVEDAAGPLDEEALLRDWCRSAGISPNDTALILETRITGAKLPTVLPSSDYARLRKRRQRAEARLKEWLSRQRAA